MSDFKVISGMIGGQAIDATSTTANHRLGQCVRAIDMATAMSINVAGSYGWYQISGKAVAKSKAANADNVAQYLTSTAGSCDDAVVAGDRIHGFISGSAVDTPSTGLIEIEMNYALTDNIAD